MQRNVMQLFMLSNVYWLLKFEIWIISLKRPVSLHGPQRANPTRSLRALLQPRYPHLQYSLHFLLSPHGAPLVYCSSNEWNAQQKNRVPLNRWRRGGHLVRAKGVVTRGVRQRHMSPLSTDALRNSCVYATQMKKSERVANSLPAGLIITCQQKQLFSELGLIPIRIIILSIN